MASIPTINDLRGLPDPLLQYKWTLIVPNVPGGADGRRFQYQCKTSVIPGLSAEEVVVTSHGIDLQYMGRQMYGQSFSSNFFETRDLYVYTMFRNWLDLGRNHRAGTGSYKSTYATKAQMLLLDDTNKTIATLNLDGFFVQDLGEASMDGGSSAPVEFSVTFKFDVSYLS